jgi:16S rRNA pseudouridine516 synthase
MAERIDKILAHEGFGSRKDIRKLLHNCEVCINGVRVTDAGKQLDPQRDIITIDGEEVDLHQNLYIMMNKIMHTVSSNKDGEHQTVFDLLDDSMRTPYLAEKLHLVGRLDMDTEGLLLFTTDGELTHRVTSPKTHIDKTYFCVLAHPEDEAHWSQIEKSFAEGIEVGPEDNEQGFLCKPATVKRATKEEYELYTKNSSVTEKIEKELGDQTETSNLYTQSAILTITEGKYHQVKRMFQAVDNKVVFLKRISMGRLQLDTTLLPGEYKLLDEDEVSLLF